MSPEPAFVIVSDTASLAAGSTGTLKLSFPTFATKPLRLIVNSTDRFAIEGIKDKTGTSYLTRVVDSGQLTQVASDVFPVNTIFGASEELTIDLRDLSGAANDVYIGFMSAPTT